MTGHVCCRLRRAHESSAEESPWNRPRRARGAGGEVGYLRRFLGLVPEQGAISSSWRVLFGVLEHGLERGNQLAVGYGLVTRRHGATAGGADE